MSQRKTWLEDEDRTLKMLVQERGTKSWAQISRIMAQEFNITGRSGKQCRERYHNHLDNRIKHGPWNRQEEHLLVEMQNSFGNRWADISRAIAGRSQNSVKNKYFSIVRRGVRVLNTAIRRQLKKYKQLDMHSIRQIVDAFDPTTPKEYVTSEQISCGDIKKRLLFYGLRDQALPMASEDYVDIKRLIDDIRFRRKNMGNIQRLEHVAPINEEYPEKQVREDTFVKDEILEEKREQRIVEENSEEKTANEGILGFKKLSQISLQNLALSPLQQQQQSGSEMKQYPLNHIATPKMSKGLSNLSNFQNKQMEAEHRQSELLRKQSTLRSFQFPELQYMKSPFMMIDSPHFDQPCRSSFNSWSYLFHH